MSAEVNFETKCYERDWEFHLRAGRLQKMIEYCDYKFTKKTLYINNVDDPLRVQKYADKAVSQGIIDEWILVEKHAQEVLRNFGLTKDDFKGGYYYSIQELTGIFLCKSKYLLHFSGDTMMQTRKPWIDDAIEKMEQNPRFIVANPTWSRRFDEAQAQSFDEDDQFYFGYGFSDQCYLVKPEFFRKDIYHETHADSARYPKYGGELFEKRVDSFMRTNNYFRLTSKTATHRHRNFPRKKWKRWIWLNLGIKIE